MARMIVLTPADARYGFSLAGVEQRCLTPATTEETLQQLLRDAETGVVAVDERLLVEIPPERLRQMEQRWYGVLVVLPAPTGGAGEDYAAQLIRRVIGYHVRLPATAKGG